VGSSATSGPSRSSKAEDRNLLTRWNVDNGDVARYVFREGKPGGAWALAAIEDVTGQGLDLSYDAGRLACIRQRLERRALLLNYNRGGLLESVSFPLPDDRIQILARYEYDTRGRLSSAYDARGLADHHEYDEDSRLTREMVKDGGVFSFTYDGSGRCIKTSGIDGYDEKRLHYSDQLRMTEVTDSLGQTSRFHLTPMGQVAVEIGPTGSTRRTVYDEYGRIVAEIGPEGASTLYQYDDRGNQSGITNPPGHSYRFRYNASHRLVSLEDPAGHVWSREHDHRNRVVATRDPLGFGWTFAYDDRGNLARITNPNGASVSQEFTETGVLHASTDWEGRRTYYTFDPFGHLAERADAGGRRTPRLEHLDVDGSARTLWRTE
jgi:YD repeat-containing protein